MKKTNSPSGAFGGKTNMDLGKPLGLLGPDGAPIRRHTAPGMRGLEAVSVPTPEPRQITQEEIEELRRYSLEDVEVTRTDVNTTILGVFFMLIEQMNEMHKRVAETIPNLSQSYTLETYPVEIVGNALGNLEVNYYTRVRHNANPDKVSYAQMKTTMLGAMMRRDPYKGWLLKASVTLGIPREAVEMFPAVAGSTVVQEGPGDDPLAL